MCIDEPGCNSTKNLAVTSFPALHSQTSHKSSTIPKHIPLHAIMCPISPGSRPPQSKGCSIIDLLWRVSHLNSGAEGLLGQHRRVLTDCLFFWVLTLGSPCHCPPVLLWASADESSDGLMVPGMAWEYLQAGITWSPPPALSELLGGLAYEFL